MESGNYDIFIGGWNISPVNDFTFMFGSTELNGESGNIINYNSAKMDEYLTACKNAVTDDDMKAAIQSCKNIYHRNFRISVLYSGNQKYTGAVI